MLVCLSWWWDNAHQIHFVRYDHFLVISASETIRKSGLLWFFQQCFLSCRYAVLLIVFWHWYTKAENNTISWLHDMNKIIVYQVYYHDAILTMNWFFHNAYYNLMILNLFLTDLQFAFIFNHIVIPLSKQKKNNKSKINENWLWLLKRHFI